MAGRCKRPAESAPAAYITHNRKLRRLPNRLSVILVVGKSVSREGMAAGATQTLWLRVMILARPATRSTRKDHGITPVDPAEQDATSVRRILCIDGGGILGTFPAAFLAAIESELDRPISDYFDLIAGTSTGGILGIGLGMGLKASDILDLYENRGPEIFASIPINGSIAP